VGTAQLNDSSDSDLVLRNWVVRPKERKSIYLASNQFKNIDIILQTCTISLMQKPATNGFP